MKLNAVVAFLALSAVAVAGHRDLLRRAESTSIAVANGPGTRATAYGTSTGGTTTVIAKSDSEAFAEAEEVVIEFVKYVFQVYKFPPLHLPKEHFCTETYVALEKKLKAVGRAMAEARAKTYTFAHVDGEGYGCAEAEADAEAFASSFAKILVKAIVSASPYYGDEHAVKLEIETRIDVFAAALAEAWSTACAGDYSKAESESEATAAASIEAIALVVIDLAVGVDCKGTSKFVVEVENKEESDAESKVKTKATAEGPDAKASAGGSANGFTTVLEECYGVYKQCCYGYCGHDLEPFYHYGQPAVYAAYKSYACLC